MDLKVMIVKALWIQSTKRFKATTILTRTMCTEIVQFIIHHKDKVSIMP